MTRQTIPTPTIHDTHPLPIDGEYEDNPPSMVLCFATIALVCAVFWSLVLVGLTTLLG